MNEPAELISPAEPLSDREKKLLYQMENEIEQNLRGFKKVGYALMVIRDQRLYRYDYDSFEEYCRKEWDLGRPRAYQLIDGYAVVQNLSPTGDNLSVLDDAMSTIVDKHSAISFDILPVNEAQTRPLTVLSPDQQVSAWQMVLDVVKAEGLSRVTAELVQRCVNEILHNNVAGAIEKAKTIRDRQEKSLPDQVRTLFDALLEEVQRGADNNWREVGRRELAKALREVLQAIEA